MWRNCPTQIQMNKTIINVSLATLTGAAVTTMLITDVLPGIWRHAFNAAIGLLVAYVAYRVENDNHPESRDLSLPPADAYYPPLLDALDDVMFNLKSDDPAIQQAYEDDVDHARTMVRAIEAHFLDDVAHAKQLDLLRKAGFELMYPHGSGWTKGFKPVTD